MVSLTTVYVLSVILTSIAGIGSSFAANKMTGGSAPLPEQPVSPLPSAPPPEDEEDDRYKESTQSNTEQTEQAVVSQAD